MPVSLKVQKMIEGSSWVRRMFEEAARMKRQFGEDRVLDFTLGNPVDEPPPVFKGALMRLAHDPAKGVHRYMPNHGFSETCLLYTSPSPRDLSTSRMPSSA